MDSILKRRIGQMNFICPEDEGGRPITPGTPLRRCSKCSDIPSSLTMFKESSKVDKNSGNTSTPCKNVCNNNVKLKSSIKMSSSRLDLASPNSSHSDIVSTSLSGPDSSSKTDRDSSSLAKSIVNSRIDSSCKSDRDSSVLFKSIADNGEKYTKLFCMEKVPSFPVMQKTNKMYEKQKPKPSSTNNIIATDKRNNNISTPGEKNKKSKNTLPNYSTRTIYRKTAEATPLIVSAFFSKADKKQSKEIAKKPTPSPSGKVQPPKKDDKPVPNVIGTGAPVPMLPQPPKQVAPVLITPQPPKQETPVPIPPQPAKQGAPVPMPFPKPIDQKAQGDDGGVSICKDKNGAICFKVPGKVLHKTTIKVTHIPQGGQEIFKIDDPFNYYQRPDPQAAATNKNIEESYEAQSPPQELEQAKAPEVQQQQGQENQFQQQQPGQVGQENQFQQQQQPGQIAQANQFQQQQPFLPYPQLQVSPCCPTPCPNYARGYAYNNCNYNLYTCKE